VATAVSLLAGYQVLAHRITVSSDPGFWRTLWAIAPLAGLSLWLAWRWRRPSIVIALTLAILAGLAEFWPQIRGHQDWGYWLQHLGVNLLLMLSMGSSLLPGRQPLCSRLAARVRGALPAEVATYTRGVTLAWTLFSGVMAITSTLLFWLAPITVWSVFANLLTLPLVVLMFLGEYGVRLRVLPPELRSGPLEAIRAYQRFRMQSDRTGRPAAPPSGSCTRGPAEGHSIHAKPEPELPASGRLPDPV
jgi:uncharacterized membrane protein